MKVKQLWQRFREKLSILKNFWKLNEIKLLFLIINSSFFGLFIALYLPDSIILTSPDPERARAYIGFITCLLPFFYIFSGYCLLLKRLIIYLKSALENKSTIKPTTLFNALSQLILLISVKIICIWGIIKLFSLSNTEIRHFFIAIYYFVNTPEVLLALELTIIAIILLTLKRIRFTLTN